MENKSLPDRYYLKNPRLKQLFRIMRLTTFLLMICVFFTYADNTHSQNARVSINKINAPLDDILNEIEKQTDYLFIYNNQVDVNRKVSVKVRTKPVSSVLESLFKGADINYSMEGTHIVLSKRDESVTQQNSRQITGTVTDTNGEPVIGANVLEKGTTNGTITDVNGWFQLTVNQQAVLTISYIGFMATEVATGNLSNLKITLREDTKALEEVVVVGYGSVRKSDLTSSVTSVKAEDMAVSARPDIASALQGIAPGVEVSTNSASPGGELDIRIRGIGTLNDNTPLFVVDGMPVNSLEFVSPNDIERMEILKDATSSAIYGSRGSNGVVLITTKSGQQANGKYIINFDGSFGVQDLIHKLDMADATEFAMIYNEAREASNVEGRIDLNSIKGKGTDWIDEISNSSAIVQNYNLNVTGGNNTNSISAGLSYYNQEGIIKSSDYERYTARMNAVVKPNKVATLNFNVIAGHIDRNSISGEKDQYGGILFNAFLIDPITEVMKPESEWVSNPYSNYARSKYTMIGNPMGVMARSFNNAKTYSIIFNAGVKLDFTKELSFKTTIGIDYRENKRKVFSPDYYINPSEKTDDNKIENYSDMRFGYVWENTLNYQKTFNDVHRLGALLGYTMEYNKSEGLSGSRTNTPGNASELQYIQLGTQNNNVDGSFSERAMISYLGRINYSFMDKYIVTANFRADGSSRFAKGNKWGFFPSVSGAWVVSNEDFFPKNIAIDYLKLRLGYGQIGNQNISNYAYLDQVRNTYRYPFGGSLIPGFATYYPGNPGVKWETTEDISIGLDGGFWNNTLTWTLDIYRRKTKDMLLRNPVPAYTGLYSNATNLSAGIWDNVGSLQNEGLELSLEYRGKIHALNYRVGGNIAFVKNEITELGDVEFISGGNIRTVGDITRSAVNSSIARFWGYRTNGIFKSEEEVKAHSKEGVLIQPNAKPGDLRFVDKTEDGQITDADKEWIGDPLPDFTAGLNLNLEYKGFDMKIYLYALVGTDIMDASSVFYNSGKDVYNSLTGLYDKAWRASNPTATHTRLSSRDENGNYQKFSDYMLQNGSYLRLRNLQIGYTFGKDMIGKLGVNNLRLYIAAQNLFTITRYDGFEPETSSSSVTTLGIDYGNYPNARSFLLGVNVSF
ncbi:MAG: TonB-dependent receptor [Tannerellaceae bacterium]|jgi:TonB-linked SusC/RagA family outer membrane protein|nr:TonB-dependent receptor [Tannerellaceae bacterium]